jgi:hypothetical protein
MGGAAPDPTAAAKAPASALLELLAHAGGQESCELRSVFG